jgi:hypothetical protein
MQADRRVDRARQNRSGMPARQAAKAE